MDEAKKATPRASKKDWNWVETSVYLTGIRCILGLRDRVAALEAAVQPTPAAAPAGGVTVEELEGALGDALEACGYLPADHSTAARHLLHHPRLGPLLRGEGGKRVVLAKQPPVPEYLTNDPFDEGCLTGYYDGWAAARAEVARQQGEVL